MIDVGVFNSTSTKQSNMLIEATMFYALKLMDEGLVDELCIDIHLSSEVRDINGDLIEAGTYPADNNPKPRHFIIELATDNKESIYQNLAHEMVHVKQWAVGDLKNTLGQDSSWKGLEWIPNKREDAYFDSPWEIEAFGRERGLYHNWKRRNEI